MTTSHNLLIIPILDILKQSEQAISEHELIVQLQQQLDALPNRPKASSLALFQTHFMVMNALYQLQQQLAEDSLFLHVSPLKIYLQIAEVSSTNSVMDTGSDELLRSYYLDWNNLQGTSEQDVDALLNGFWQYYLSEDKQLDAYQTLDLEAGADWTTVQKTYRRLVADKHPDRGGNAAEFMAIREAYEILLKTVAS